MNLPKKKENEFFARPKYEQPAATAKRNLKREKKWRETLPSILHIIKSHFAIFTSIVIIIFMILVFSSSFSFILVLQYVHVLCVWLHLPGPRLFYPKQMSAIEICNEFENRNRTFFFFHFVGFSFFCRPIYQRNVNAFFLFSFRIVVHRGSLNEFMGMKIKWDPGN